MVMEFIFHQRQVIVIVMLPRMRTENDACFWHVYSWGKPYKATPAQRFARQATIRQRMDRTYMSPIMMHNRLVNTLLRTNN